MALTVDRQKHFIQMPCIARLRATATQPIGIILPKLPAPFADGFVGHGDPTFEQEFLHVAIAQGEAIIGSTPCSGRLGSCASAMVNDTEMMTTSKSALFILDLSRLASYHKRPNALGVK